MSTPTFPRGARLTCALTALTVLATLPAALGGEADKSSPAVEKTYMAIFMYGNKSGHVATTREVSGDQVKTTEVVNITMNRMGTPAKLVMTAASVETTDGRPLRFETGGTLGSTKGVIDEKGNLTLTVQSVMAGASRRTIPWPKGALLSEGMRLLTRKHGLKPGTRYSFKTFEPNMGQALTVDVTVGPKKEVDLLGRKAKLTEMKSVTRLAGMSIPGTEYVDDSFRLQKTTKLIGAMSVEMIVCSRAFALSPDNPVDFIKKTLIRSPVPLPDVDHARSVTYHLRAKNGQTLKGVATDSQTFRAKGAGAVVTVTPARAGKASIPYKGADKAALAALKPARYVQSDDEKVVALARQAVGTTTDAEEAARRIEAFVARYIAAKTLEHAYFSAATVARMKEGDCTEHAVLVAAMCRAVGLPAQVVSGLIYVHDTTGGPSRSFYPHAWNQAYVGGKWIGLDAAMGGFGPGHIALTAGDGDIDEYFDIFPTLGNVVIEKVEVTK